MTLDKKTELSKTVFEKEKFLKIADADQMPDFFMSNISFSSHSLFVGNNGNLSAEQNDSKYAFFPYNYSQRNEGYKYPLDNKTMLEDENLQAIRLGQKINSSSK